MAFIRPSLKKNQEIITKVWGNTGKNLMIYNVIDFFFWCELVSLENSSHMQDKKSNPMYQIANPFSYNAIFLNFSWTHDRPE